MKTKIIISFILTISVQTILGAIVEDGRSWLMGRVTYVFSEESSGEQISYFTAEVAGDTIANGLECKKIRQFF